MTAEVDPETIQPYRSENLSLDLRSLALMRIGMGVWILVDLLIRLPDIARFHTPDGYLPVSLLPSPHYVTSHFYLYRYLDSLPAVYMLYLIQAALAVALMAGAYTRIASVLSWWMLACLQSRTPILLDGGDIHMKIMLLFSCFLPLGEVWSWDARIRQKREPAKSPRNFAIKSPVTAAWTIQICLFYFFAAVLKSDPEWRVQGDALYYALSIDQFATEFAQTLIQYPGLLRVLSFAALLVEFTAPLLILFPIFNGVSRSLAILLLTCLHTGIALTLHLGLFMPACFIILIGLLPTWLWDCWTHCEFRPDDFTPRSDLNPRWPSKILASTLVAFSLVQNCAVWSELKFKIPPVIVPQVLAFGRAFSILQFWGLFAPRPFREDGWFVTAGVLKSGKVVNLDNFDGLYPPARPQLLSTQFRNQRWRRYFQNLWRRDNPNWATRYLEIRSQEWALAKQSLAQQDPVQQAYLLFVQEYSQPPGFPPLPSQYRIGQFPSDEKSVAPPVCPKCGKAHSEHHEYEINVTE